MGHNPIKLLGRTGKHVGLSVNSLDLNGWDGLLSQLLPLQVLDRRIEYIAKIHIFLSEVNIPGITGYSPHLVPDSLGGNNR